MKKRVISMVIALGLLGGSVVQAGAVDFSDVSSTDWFYKDVEEVAREGYINGMGDGTFDPYGTLTVAQAIKLASGVKARFNQDKISSRVPEGEHWVANHYKYAVDSGLITEADFPKSTLEDNILREDMFYLFANAREESTYEMINDVRDMPEKTSDASINKLFKSGIVIGNENGFESKKTITRCETAAIINRIINREYRVVIGNGYSTPTPEPTATPSPTPVPYIPKPQGGMVSVTPKPSTNSDEDEVLSNGYTRYQVEMLELVNNSRVEAGSPELELSPILCEIAEDLATQFSQGSEPHKLLNGKDDVQILIDYNIDTQKYNGTNYGMGHNLPAKRFHNNILNSPKHKETMLCTATKYYGVAKVMLSPEDENVHGYNSYWVEIFMVDIVERQYGF